MTEIDTTEAQQSRPQPGGGQPNGSVLSRNWAIGLTLVAASALIAITIRRAVTGSGDIDKFHEAGRYLWDHRAVIQGSDINRYPPPFHALMALLGWAPLGLVAFVRTALSLILLWDLPRRFERLAGIPLRRQWPAWLVAAPFLLDNLFLGQQGALLLWLVTVGTLCAQRGRPILGGALISSAMWIKVLPIGFLAIPIILGRQWKSLIGVVVSTLLLFGLLFLFTGVREGLAEGPRWWRLVRTDYSPQSMIDQRLALRYNNQSVPIVLARTFGDVHAPDYRGAVRIASWPLPVIWAMHRALLAVLAAVVLVTLWRGSRDRADPRYWLGTYGMIAIAMMTISPLAWTYYFFWLLPGCLFLSHRRRLLWALFAASALALTSGYARGIGAHMIIGLIIFACCAVDLWRKSYPLGDEESLPGSAGEFGGRRSEA